MIQVAAYYLCLAIVAAGLAAGLILDGALVARNSAGVPQYVPAVSSLLLILAAERFRTRAGGDYGALCQALSLPYAIGAACAAMVPLLVLLNRPRALVVLHAGLVLALLVIALIRALVRLWQMASRFGSREMREAAALVWCAIGTVPVAIALEEAGMLSARAAEAAGFVCYGSIALATANLLHRLPKGPTWITEKPG